MEYEIWNKKELIAKFKWETDRDVCLDALIDRYPDVKFTVKEIK